MPFLHRPKTRSLIMLALVSLVCWGPAGGDELPIVVAGVEDPLAENVVNHVRANWVLGTSLATESRRRVFLEKAREHAREGLRPWGYYQPDIDARLDRIANGNGWRLQLDIEPGAPVLVGQTDIEIEGDGASLPELRAWRDAWPLTTGVRLDQTVWNARKEHAIESAHAAGFLNAAFTRQRIALDLDNNIADLNLTLQTGQRAVMGRIEYQQDTVQPHVLTPVARFQPGDPYRSELVEDLRLDLWRTGYFGDIEVIELRRLDQAPPVVDFLVRLSPRNRVTHQFTLGYGTDTRVRTQYHWTRHLLSDRGDSLRIGAGWRQQDSEILTTGEYRLPRRMESRQFWLVNSVLRRETREFLLKDDNDQELLRIAKGQILDMQHRLGRLRLHNNPWSDRLIQSTLFVELLSQRDNFAEEITEAVPDPSDTILDDLFGDTFHTIAVGMDWDWPVIRGSGFATTGHHERAWIFTANEAWGSEKDFTQVYLSSRWNHLLGDRWKILLRGEIGWSDADLLSLELPGEPESSTILATELPYRYSFKAGGSQSVRGYGYNQLSNNGIGSNHLLVGSAELEYLFLNQWSLAAFYDVGNAFNDWDNPRLKRGAGFGVRWYSLLGSVRLDAAQGLDIPGKPWEIYLTIGTPLL